MCEWLADRWIGFSPSPCVTLAPQFGELARPSMRIVARVPRGCWLSGRYQSAFARSFLREVLVWCPANNFLKAVESESQFFRAKAANKPSKIVKLFAARDTSVDRTFSVCSPRWTGAFLVVPAERWRVRLVM